VRRRRTDGDRNASVHLGCGVRIATQDEYIHLERGREVYDVETRSPPNGVPDRVLVGVEAVTEGSDERRGMGDVEIRDHVRVQCGTRQTEQ
jgi:hypothetical protein